MSPLKWILDPSKAQKYRAFKKNEPSELGLEFDFKARSKWDWKWVEQAQPGYEENEARPGCGPYYPIDPWGLNTSTRSKPSKLVHWCEQPVLFRVFQSLLVYIDYYRQISYHGRLMYMDSLLQYAFLPCIDLFNFNQLIIDDIYTVQIVRLVVLFFQPSNFVCMLVFNMLIF